jgi:hypothetical protein
MMPGVDGLGFTAALIDSLSWPLAAVAIAFMFRRQVRDLISARGLTRVKAGPFEAEWSTAQAVVPSQIRAHVPPDSDRGGVNRESAAVSPRSTILARYDSLIQRLKQEVASREPNLKPHISNATLINLALERGIISDKTERALVGATVMRNLAAHSGQELTEARAAEFLAITDATEYAMVHDFARLGPDAET